MNSLKSLLKDLERKERMENRHGRKEEEKMKDASKQRAVLTIHGKRKKAKSPKEVFLLRLLRRRPADTFETPRMRDVKTTLYKSTNKF